MRKAVILTFAVLCVSLTTCSNPDTLPEPKGPLVPANASVPPDYTGNGITPVIGGRDQRL